ncbi:uncharacterized protein [Halyomorpha halys]|uniref:uncharacterized protein n=1 Tax=Halyomorpha halys TaxID=286706 RepID=UPI0034D284B4
MSLGLDFATHIGCFKSTLLEFHNQFISNESFVSSGKLTPEICVDHCKGKGFKYAGIHSRFNCLCSNSRPQCDITANCYYRHNGNINEMCRGPDRINFYKVHDELSNEMDQNYIGCFLDGGTRERIFATKKAIKQKFVTPEPCIEFCYRKGYTYAGITYRFLCSCDNQLGTKKKEELCNKYPTGTSLASVRKMYMRLYYTNLSS